MRAVPPQLCATRRQPQLPGGLSLPCHAVRGGDVGTRGAAYLAEQWLPCGSRPACGHRASLCARGACREPFTQNAVFVPIPPCVLLGVNEYGHSLPVVPLHVIFGAGRGVAV